MIISSSCIGMDSTRVYNSSRMDASVKTKDSTGSFIGFFNDTGSLTDIEENRTEGLSDTLEDIRLKYDFLKVNNSLSSKLEQDAVSRIKSQCLQYLLRMLIGHHGILDEETPSWENFSFNTANASVSFSNGMTSVTETYSFCHFYTENEETCFSTVGTVQTGDGRSIDFNLNVSMSRSFSEYYETYSEKTSYLCDPLIINLDADIAEVSDVKFRFDIDSDGEEDLIPVLSEGSGFLAIDLNDDGIINNGSELFGTKSGNGFEDLAAYDSDNNGWIDEADEVFDRLKIYTVGSDGSQDLVSLKDKDIGAIYLGSVSTTFSLNSLTTNETNGVIRSSGVFLYENGSVGSIQQVDLSKAEYTA